MGMKMIVATRNLGKLKEYKSLLADLPLDLYSLADYPAIPAIEETGASFSENAFLKARFVKSYTGLLTLADDSGLEVDFLQGAPGVHSARFAGEPSDDRRNNRKLLDLLEGVPPDLRTARFRCAIAVVTSGGEEESVEGTCEGLIQDQETGDKGFGYDPLFFLPELGKTMAELDLEEKNKISHRAKALKKAKGLLLELVPNLTE